MGESHIDRSRASTPGNMAKSLKIDLRPAPNDLTAEQAYEMAKLAEHAERHEDMAAYMARVVKDKSGDELTVDERNMISVGFKNMMTAYRTAWREMQEKEMTPDLADNFREAA